MTRAPGLSVLTLARGRRDHLDRLIEGLRRSQTIPDELIIVDMGGPPINPPRANFPIEILPLPGGGLALARARNLAASQARHECLLFLDVDCIPMAGLAGAMRAALERQNALICAEIHYLLTADLPTDWREWDLRHISKPHPARSFPATGLRAEPHFGLFWSLAFAIRAALFEQIGGFDEDFTGYGAEDTDFGFRARQTGVPLLFIGGAGAFHQHHAVFDPPLQHFEDIVRNAQIFYRKWRFWPMEGWLDAFEHLGLLHRDQATLTIVRQPTKSEIQAAQRTTNV